MAIPQSNFEPVSVVQGDTISFIRAFGDYPASQGWHLEYNMRGGAAPIQFSSSAQADSHVILVTAATTETWLPSEYILEGFAVNSTTGERERIYLNNLTVTLDTATAAPDVDIRTHAQKMIELIENVQLGKYKHDLLNTDVEGTRIMRLTPMQLREEYQWWLSQRKQEVAKANALAGRSNGRNRFEVFVDPAGQGLSQFGALPPIFPFGGNF